MFLSVLDGTVVFVALPRIQDAMHLSDAAKVWVFGAYVLTFSGFMLLGGRLGDSFGRKRMFILGVAGFTLASLLTGFATSQTWLLAARAGQVVRSQVKFRAARGSSVAMWMYPEVKLHTLILNRAEGIADTGHRRTESIQGGADDQPRCGSRKEEQPGTMRPASPEPDGIRERGSRSARRHGRRRRPAAK